MSSKNNMERPDLSSGYADQETSGGKSLRKIRDDPLVPLGILGTIGTVAYGIHNYRNRPKGMGTGMYIMRFRVMAQTVVVSAVVFSVGYTSIKQARKRQEAKENGVSE